jgi:hypothetical protein
MEIQLKLIPHSNNKLVAVLRKLGTKQYHEFFTWVKRWAFKLFC